MTDAYQIILVVETTKKANIDNRYIREVIRHYFPALLTSSNIKLQFVFMNGKYNWNNERTLKYINELKESMDHSKSIIVYSIDMDKYDSDKRDQSLCNSVLQHCKDTPNHFCILFNRDIEFVLIGESVNDKLKKRKVDWFIKNNEILKIPHASLSNSNPMSLGHSNILHVLQEIEKIIGLR